MTNSITRRTALKAAMGGEPESEIMRLFREWWEIFNADPLLPSNLTREEADRILDAQAEGRWDIEDEMMDLPSRSIEDLAAKVLVWTQRGSEVEFPAPGFVAEMEALVGLTS